MNSFMPYTCHPKMERSIAVIPWNDSFPYYDRSSASPKRRDAEHHEGRFAAAPKVRPNEGGLLVLIGIPRTPESLPRCSSLR